MNHSALISRAFQITRRYRVLWIFGILAALTSARGGGNSGYSFDREDFGGGRWSFRGLEDLDPRRLSIPGLGYFDPNAIVGVIAFCCCLLLLVALAALVANYVARTALFRMVDGIETSGAAPNWREGFRLGWSRRTLRLFLLELIVGIAAFFGMLLVLAVAASPLLLLITENDAARAIGIAMAVVLGVLALLLTIIAVLLLGLLGEFWSREIVLGDRSVGQALASGYLLVRRNLKNVGIMWLLMAGISIGFTLLMIPVFLIVALLAGGLGGGLGYAVYAATNSVPWAVVAGLPVALLVITVPLAFIGGLYQVFTSSAWTLTYREIVLRRGAALAVG